jgi:hypothetical protein
MKASFNNQLDWMPALRIVLAFFVIACFQVFWHWFLSRPSGLSQSLLRFYLSYDPAVGKGVSGWFDTVIPCICLGFLIGFVSWNWPVPKVAIFVLLAAVGLVALLPLYTIILNKESIWWWPKADGELAVFFLKNFVKAALMVGVFAYGGRCFGVHFKAGQIS